MCIYVHVVEVRMYACMRACVRACVRACMYISNHKQRKKERELSPQKASINSWSPAFESLAKFTPKAHSPGILNISEYWSRAAHFLQLPLRALLRVIIGCFMCSEFCQFQRVEWRVLGLWVGRKVSKSAHEWRVYVYRISVCRGGTR